VRGAALLISALVLLAGTLLRWATTAGGRGARATAGGVADLRDGRIVFALGLVGLVSAVLLALDRGGRRPVGILAALVGLAGLGVTVVDLADPTRMAGLSPAVLRALGVSVQAGPGLFVSAVGAAGVAVAGGLVAWLPARRPA